MSKNKPWGYYPEDVPVSAIMIAAALILIIALLGDINGFRSYIISGLSQLFDISALDKAPPFMWNTN